MSKKNTYDIHALQFAFDVCANLFKEAQKDESVIACAQLLKACEVFNQAIKDADAEMEEARFEQEMNTARSIFPFKDKTQSRTWNDYVDRHCESMEDIDIFDGYPDGDE